MDSRTRELGVRLHGLLRSVRLLKQRRADERPAVPPGLVGILLQIEQLAAGCHARELAARTRLDPSTVSRAVAALVAHGLVERRPDPTDKRASFLAVTPAGRAALTHTYDWYGEVLGRALADWTPGEVAALGAGLDRFVRDVEAALAAPESPAGAAPEDAAPAERGTAGLAPAAHEAAGPAGRETAVPADHDNVTFDNHDNLEAAR